MERVLGIETSCDETAAAVVEAGSRIVSNVVLSQTAVHSIYGGIVPELASREHLRAIVPVVRQALELAATPLREIDAIAVTYGPGLVGALLVGLTYAKALALASGKPMVGVHHLEGHLHAVLLEERRQQRPDPPFPAVALVVSGGHTQLYRVERPSDTEFRYQLLGQTRDDAAGEAYDKVAKLLGLGYPGGPLLDRLAGHGNAAAVPFGRVRLKGNPLDFSFSGLKTAVLRHTETHSMAGAIAARQRAIAALGRPPELEDWLEVCEAATLDLIAAFQAAVVNELTARTMAAVEAQEAAASPPAAVFLTGGVAANRALRERLRLAAAERALPLFLPAPALCTDNAAMIAAAAWPKVCREAWSSSDLAPYAQLRLE